MSKKQFQKLLADISTNAFTEQVLEIHYNRPLIDIDACQLANALEQNTNITELDLSNNAIGDTGATALSQLSTLKIVNLNQNNVTEVGAAILGNSALISLFLSGNRIHYNDNNHTNFQKMISNFCNNKTIEDLDLSFVSIPDRMVAQLINENNTIRLFRASTDFTDRALKYIGNNTALRELYIYKSTITKKGVDYLLLNNRLIFLFIEYSNIDDSAALALSTHPSLRDLILTDSNITKEGVKAFYNTNIDRVVLCNSEKQSFISFSELQEFEANFQRLKEQKDLDVLSALDTTEGKIAITENDELQLIGNNENDEA